MPYMFKGLPVTIPKEDVMDAGTYQVYNPRRRVKGSANLVSVPTRRAKRKKATKDVVARNFKIAYNKMIPSKQIQFNVTDVAMATDTLANRTNLVDLTSIAQGTQLNQRMRNKIHLSYVHIRGTIQSNASKAKFLRIVVFSERNNGTLNGTTFANLLHDYAYDDQAPAGIQTDGRYKINPEQYRVHFDKVITLPTEVESAKHYFYKVRVNRRIYYPLAGSGTSACTNGKLYFISLLFDGDNGTEASSVIYSGLATAYFKDNF